MDVEMDVEMDAVMDVEMDATLEKSKIVVEAVPFQRALDAAIAVASTKEPLDVVQFRIIGDSLYVNARSLTASLSVTVPTELVMANFERDNLFEVSLASAKEMAARRMTQKHSEEELMLGLTVYENCLVRTDESGMGLGVRAMQVPRCSLPWGTVLGDINRAVEVAVCSPSTTDSVLLDSERYGLLRAVSRKLHEPLQVWVISEPGTMPVRVAAKSDSAGMVLIYTQEGRTDPAADPATDQDTGVADDVLEAQLSLVSPPRVDEPKKVDAVPPKGFA